MKILIVGRPDSGQRQVVEKILGSSLDESASLEGLVLEHTIETRYFKQECGVWVDQYEDAQEWLEAFTSDEAKEVREVLMMVIYTVGDEVDPQLAEFKKKLQDEDWSGYFCAYSKKELGQLEQEQLEETLDMDLVSLSELKSLIESALIDFQEPGEDSHPDVTDLGEPRDLLEPLIEADLDEIMSRLKLARDSDMTDQEKLELAEQIARELVP